MTIKNKEFISDFFHLLGTNLQVQSKNFTEYLKVIFNYYPSWSFLKTDLVLQAIYLFNNPFTISKRFLMRKGEKDVYAYGETPLTTLEKIIKECRIASKDTVFELGSGRGRVCFWLNSYYGCKVVGIEQVPEFVERSNAIVDKLQLKNIEFRNQDMLNANFTGANTIYLYGTCLEDTFIEKLAKKLSFLPKGTKIITVSYPLTDYTDNKFEVLKRFSAKFTWGIGDVFLQVVK